MKNNDLNWLAGLLEGEGSFIKGSPSNPNQPSINLQMTDEDIVARVATLFQVSYYKNQRKNKPTWNPIYICRVKGIRAHDIMVKLKPLMGTRRKSQIDAALLNYIKRSPGDFCRKLSNKQVIEILDQSNKTLSELGKLYNINRAVIRRIRSGTTWKHIDRCRDD